MKQPSDVLVTPTARLARHLIRTTAVEMSATGTSAWHPPKVLSASAWLRQMAADHMLSSDDQRAVIDSALALPLWQQIVEQDVFAGGPQVARLAQRAWRTIHEYRLDAPETWPTSLLSEDNRRFRDWAISYQRKCDQSGLLDEWAFFAELPMRIEQGGIHAPRQIELVGFDLPMTPLQTKILSAFERAGASVLRRETSPRDAATPQLSQFEQPEDELRAAAIWARKLVEESADQSIAIVVPDLSERVDQADRVFREIFDPLSFSLQEPGLDPWHISLGKPLANWYLVADALCILQLGSKSIDQPAACRLLRSPFLAGWQEEGKARNRTLIALARWAPRNLTPEELQRALRRSGAGTLAEKLCSWQQVRKDGKRLAWPSEWLASLQKELSSLGFGLGRSLNSPEFQALQRWHELLEAISALDAVSHGPVSRREVLCMILERARSSIFRERNPGTPIEILGVEEALGSRFDALWITTLDFDTWPGPSRRDPLIPSYLQGFVPHATNKDCLQRARQELAGLCASAPVVRGSFASGSEEIPSELTALMRGSVVDVAPVPPLPEKVALGSVLEDIQGPALRREQVKGGTAVLQEQSSCPFRAFATRRLDAVPHELPRAGLDAGQRGSLVHKALELFWADLSGHAELVSLPASERQERVGGAVTAALDKHTEGFTLRLTAVERSLEQMRIESLLYRWLEIEEARDGFSVIAPEHKLGIRLGGIRLVGKLDRLDRQPDGSTLLIDYKTGASHRSAWFPEARIADPQLPAYAVSMEPRPRAISFAHLRPEALQFEGLSDGDTGNAGVLDIAKARGRFKNLDSWDELLQAWESSLENLATDFRAGNAAVDPIKPGVCDNCHLHSLCRIYERYPSASMTEENGNG